MSHNNQCYEQWPSPEVAQALYANKMMKRFETLRIKLETFFREQNIEFEFGATVHLIQVHYFLPGNNLVIELDSQYFFDEFDSNLINTWATFKLNKCSMVRIYEDDILHDRFDWKNRLIRFFKKIKESDEPILYLPNRPDKEFIRNLFLPF